MALLASSGRSQRLSVDHRADNAAELMRVLSAGGEVDYDRFGTLRVYRPSDIGRTNGAMFTRWGTGSVAVVGMGVMVSTSGCFSCRCGVLILCGSVCSAWCRLRGIRQPAACPLGIMFLVLQVPW